MTPSDEITVDSVLGEAGSIGRRLKGYEVRPQQLAMGHAVQSALTNSEHLVAEAGTGTGKSFAYLVPAILYATENQADSTELDEEDDDEDDAHSSSRRVVISTHTISLQEQLIAKDIPLLNSVIAREFSAVLVKGRSNYLSIRRLDRAQTKAVGLFDRDQQHAQLRDIKSWAGQTSDGSLATLPVKPDAAVWDEVHSDTGNCLRRKCPHFADCFYFKARRRASHAQLLVVNHALFFSDLALRQQGVSLLPDYDAVILDECHTIEAVASDHLGIRLSSGQYEYLFNRLCNEQTDKGLLVAHQLHGLKQVVRRCRFAADNLFASLLHWWETSGRTNGRVEHAGVVENPLSEPMEELARGLRRQAEGRSDADRLEFESASERVLVLAGGLRQWLNHDQKDSVYWLEKTGSRRGIDRVSLAASPTNVGNMLREQLFQNRDVRSVIMTSATLATGTDDRFSFFRSRVGLTDGQSIRVGSPFDYERQSRVVVVRDMPDPSSQREAFERELPNQIKRFASESDGHAFVLFTSYGMLNSCATAIAPWLAARGMQLYSQAGTQNRTQLLDAFRRNPHGLLFGTDSFWQGVDVPGEALTNVIITKLPFAVPNHPLLEAKLEAIQARGGNPFTEYQVPEAVIKFRQGVGRLIRTAQDRGMVVVLDPRVRTKPYGQLFLSSLPKQPIAYVTKEFAAARPAERH